MSERSQEGDRRGHATRMFAWEDQVARDPDAKRQATALRAVTIIRREVGRKVAGKALVDQRWLANEVGVSRRGLQKALGWLEKRGHLIINSRKHLRLPNFYEPVVKAMRTGGRIADGEGEREFAVDSNASAENPRTAVRTDTVTPSKFSGPNPRSSERGKYELELVERLGLGSDGLDILSMLSEADREFLCKRQSRGEVTEKEIEGLKLRFRRYRSNDAKMANAL